MIYLDSNATAPVDPLVLEAMLPFLRDQFANPSASYRAARQVQQAIEKARTQAAALIGASPTEVIFTSGGTESNNTAVESAKLFWPDRKHLIVGATEHPAILEPAMRWRAQGGTVSVVPVGRDGQIDLDALASAVRSQPTALVSIMWANNETGVTSPVETIAQIAHDAGALFHTDAVQAAGKIDIDLSSLPIDMLSLSGHKFHAPKGVGVLYVNRRSRFQPWFVGGGQEGGRRSGTENVPSIVALGVAATLANGHSTSIGCMRDAFELRIRAALPSVTVNGHRERRLPGTSNLCFPSLSAVEMLILLDSRGLCCAAGSACHTANVHPSPVLEAMGFSEAHAASSLRFSFSRMNTMAEIDEAADYVIAVATKLQNLRGDDSSPVALS